MRRRPLAQMVVVGAIATAIGIFVALPIDWFPPRASRGTPRTDDSVAMSQRHPGVSPECVWARGLAHAPW